MRSQEQEHWGHGAEELATALLLVLQSFMEPSLQRIDALEREVEDLKKRSKKVRKNDPAMR